MEDLCSIGRFIKMIGILGGIIILLPLAAQDTLLIQPGPVEGEDAELHTFWPDSARRDSDSYCAVVWTAGGIPFTARSIIRFDLSPIGPYDTILDARLSLFGNPESGHAQGSQGDNECFLRRITGYWQEATVTWNNQPFATDLNQLILPQSTDPFQDYTGIDVTQLVADMVNDPENSYGLLLRLVTEELQRSLIFCSSDHPDPQRRPRLEIIYKECTPPTASFDFSIDKKIITFTDQSTYSTTWTWDFGDGYSAYIPNPIHEYPDYGWYRVCLSVTNECGYAEYCDSLYVCEWPVSDFQYQADGMKLALEDLSALSDGLTWDFGDGQFSIQPDPVHIYADTGTYLVCQQSMNDCGKDTLCKMIRIFPKEDSVQDGSWLFTLFPNPAGDWIYILSSASGKYLISFFKASGELVYQEESQFTAYDRKQFNISSFQEATYTVRIEGNRFVWNSTFIVIKE